MTFRCQVQSCFCMSSVTRISPCCLTMHCASAGLKGKLMTVGGWIQLLSFYASDLCVGLPHLSLKT
jgi:hypothetical protein